MDKNLKVTLIMLFSSVALIAVIVLIIINMGKDIKEKEKDKKEPKIPKITEEYTDVSLNKLKEYNYHLYFEDDEITYMNDDNLYLVYKNGIIYDNKLITDEYFDNINTIFKKYTIENIDSKSCIINKSSNKKECFDEIIPIGNKVESIDYLLLQDYGDDNGVGIKLILLDPNNDKRIDLYAKDIIDITSNSGEDYIITDEYDYLPVCSTFNKCGLITYDGKTQIEFVYDYLNYINKNYIIAYKNNKVGLINYKNETILDFNYDYIEVWNNYYVVVNNNKLSVLDNKLNKIIDNIQVKESNDDEMPYNYYAFIDNNTLYLTIEDAKNTIYQIDKKLIKELTLPYDYEIVENNKGEFKYFVFKYEKDNKITFDFYDKNLTEYYKIEKELKKNIKYYTYIMNVPKNDNNYALYMDYDIDGYNTVYYVDLFNSKELSEYEALVRYFKNGYSFVLTDSNLKIYKEKEIIKEFNGVYTYIGNYMFIEEDEYDRNSIVEIEFKKESREVSQ